MPTCRSFLLLHAFCMVLLSVTEIHAVKTLNSELRSNSQLSACILYGRKNDLIYQVISAPGQRDTVDSKYSCTIGIMDP